MLMDINEHRGVIEIHGRNEVTETLAKGQESPCLMLKTTPRLADTSSAIDIRCENIDLAKRVWFDCRPSIVYIYDHVKGE